MKQAKHEQKLTMGQIISHLVIFGEEGKLGSNAMERVAAGAQLPTPWLFEPENRPDDEASVEARIRFYT